MAHKSQKPTGTLKKFVDANRVPSRVLASVERYLLSRPTDTSRRSDVIHPSAMVKPDWCHRAEYYELSGRPPAPSKYKTSLKQLLTFEEGHRIHRGWQGWFGDMQQLYGKWGCLDCKVFTWGLGVTCDGCTSTNLTYLEVPVGNGDLRIRGHADGWVKGFGDDMLLEVKSIGEGTIRWEAPELMSQFDGDFKKAWASLKQPFTTHIMQAQVYMKLLELSNPEDHPKEALFIYESKPTQDVKEFVIAKSDFGITELFDAAAMIVKSVKDNTAPLCNLGGALGCAACRYHDLEVAND
jgi:hypothetical protein